MIKFRYKRKEPTNIVGSKDTNNTSLNASTISTKSTNNISNTTTTTKDNNNKQQNEAKENCKPNIQQKPQQTKLNTTTANNTQLSSSSASASASTTTTIAASNTNSSSSSTLKSSIPTQLITSAPINIVNSTAQHLQHPQHCQMVMTAGTGGTLPRSTPKKMMDPRDGHKSATLTRQSNTLQNNRKLLTSMAKVASTAELAGMGYTNKPANSNSNNNMTSISSGIILSPEAIQDRDRCINAVIVSCSKTD